VKLNFFLKHKITKKKIRILMRRERTLKICLNHHLFSQMKLAEMMHSDKAWTWTCPSDFSEETPKAENFAIRFANSDLAKEFKIKFEQYQKENTELETKSEPEKSLDKSELVINTEKSQTKNKSIENGDKSSEKKISSELDNMNTIKSEATDVEPNTKNTSENK